MVCGAPVSAGAGAEGEGREPPEVPGAPPLPHLAQAEAGHEGGGPPARPQHPLQQPRTGGGGGGRCGGTPVQAQSWPARMELSTGEDCPGEKGPSGDSLLLRPAGTSQAAQAAL